MLMILNPALPIIPHSLGFRGTHNKEYTILPHSLGFRGTHNKEYTIIPHSLGFKGLGLPRTGIYHHSHSSGSLRSCRIYIINSSIPMIRNPETQLPPIFCKL